MDGKLTSAPACNDAGLTLIEVLVVVAVMAVLAVSVTLALPGSGAGAKADMQRFRDSFDLQRQLAIQGSARRGFYLAPRGYTISRETAGGWLRADQRMNWRRSPAWRLETTQGATDPEVVFLPNGQTTAFSITFGQAGRCETDGWTGLICG